MYVLSDGVEADGALDKARKHKKRQLEDTLNLVIKKRKVIATCIIFFKTPSPLLFSFYILVSLMLLHFRLRQ